MKQSSIGVYFKKRNNKNKEIIRIIDKIFEYMYRVQKRIVRYNFKKRKESKNKQNFNLI